MRLHILLLSLFFFSHQDYMKSENKESKVTIIY